MAYRNPWRGRGPKGNPWRSPWGRTGSHRRRHKSQQKGCLAQLLGLMILLAIISFLPTA